MKISLVRLSAIKGIIKDAEQVINDNELSQQDLAHIQTECLRVIKEICENGIK